MTFEGILESWEARYRCGRFAEDTDNEKATVDLPLQGWHLLLCLRALKLVCEFVASSQGLSLFDSKGQTTWAHPDYWLAMAQREMEREGSRLIPDKTV